MPGGGGGRQGHQGGDLPGMLVGQLRFWVEQ